MYFRRALFALCLFLGGQAHAQLSYVPGSIPYMNATAGHCIMAGTGGQLADAGAACGSGGGTTYTGTSPIVVTGSVISAPTAVVGTATPGGDLAGAGSTYAVPKISAINGQPVYPAFQTLTYASTLNENVALGINATVTLTGNVTVSCPTNMVSGGSYQTRLVQDATGSRIVTWPSCFTWPGGVKGVLSTAANAVDVVTFTSFDGTTAQTVLSKAFQ